MGRVLEIPGYLTSPGLLSVANCYSFRFLLCQAYSCAASGTNISWNIDWYSWWNLLLHPPLMTMMMRIQLILTSFRVLIIILMFDLWQLADGKVCSLIFQETEHKTDISKARLCHSKEKNWIFKGRVNCSCWPHTPHCSNEGLFLTPSRDGVAHPKTMFYPHIYLFCSRAAVTVTTRINILSYSRMILYCFLFLLLSRSTVDVWVWPLADYSILHLFLAHNELWTSTSQVRYIIQKVFHHLATETTHVTYSWSPRWQIECW